MTRRQIALAALGALMIAALVGAAAAHQARIAAAREIVVASEAVDPRALLVGHYARLALQPAAADPGTPRPAGLTPGAKAIAHLAPGTAPGVWRVAALAAANGPAPGPAAGGDVAVAITVTQVDEDGRVSFVWGPDRVYLDQKEAVAVEEATRRAFDAAPDTPARVHAILAVEADGTTLVKGVVIDGKRIETRW